MVDAITDVLVTGPIAVPTNHFHPNLLVSFEVITDKLQQVSTVDDLLATIDWDKLSELGAVKSCISKCLLCIWTTRGMLRSYENVFRSDLSCAMCLESKNSIQCVILGYVALIRMRCNNIECKLAPHSNPTVHLKKK